MFCIYLLCVKLIIQLQQVNKTLYSKLGDTNTKIDEEKRERKRDGKKERKR